MNGESAAGGAAARSGEWPLLTVIALGGAVGAEGRYGVGLIFPHGQGQFPWSTVLINASGCLLIGALMVLLSELTSPHRLARPFLGVGVLGGYTTFSTFAVDAQQLVAAGHLWRAVAYVSTMVVVCAACVWLAIAATRQTARAVGTLMSHRKGGAAG